MLFSTEKQDKRFWLEADACLDQVRELATQKQGDYNRMCDVPDYLPRGWRDAALHVWKVALRLLNLALVPGPTHAKNEALADSFLDIINWARYGYALMRMGFSAEPVVPNKGGDEGVGRQVSERFKEFIAQKELDDRLASASCPVGCASSRAAVEEEKRRRHFEAYGGVGEPPAPSVPRRETAPNSCAHVWVSVADGEYRCCECGEGKVTP